LAAPNTSGPATERRPNYTITGERPWTFQSRNDNQPYEQEHVALIRSIRQREPINDLRRVAESTLTAIMGRMAAYGGQVVSWEEALNSQLSLMPANLTMDTPMPVRQSPSRRHASVLILEASGGAWPRRVPLHHRPAPSAQYGMRISSFDISLRS